VEAAPTDLPLRVHLAELLLGEGRGEEAVPHLGLVLAQEPGSARALELMRQALGAAVPGASPAPSTDQAATDAEAAESAPAEAAEPVAPAEPAESFPADTVHAQTPESAADADEAGSGAQGPSGAIPGQTRTPGDLESFDWDAAARDLGEIAQPLFVGEDGRELTESAYDLESSSIRLSDVGGMEQVKQRLEVAFLAPMRNPELSRMYHKSLKGGLLLYGPPGCGKTFIARAVAGELGASFISVTLADVLDMYIGNSERNLSEVFATARRNAPCVLFFDEIDAIGQRRSQLRNNAARGVVNQFLTELDGVDAANEGVFVLAATNAPWDVDVALRRPGRLDRTLLVVPPDQPAREAILRHHLKDRPVSGVKLAALAKKTDGYSGADLAHVCETAAELALMDSARTGQVRLIGMGDLEAAVAEVRPSVGAWLESARNVAMFANESGTYDDLAAYLKKRRML
jgi:AAA+ superfamily predicted ATPase